MWHRIAALLGGRSVAEWQSAMTSAEFMAWCAFYQLEPWGYDVENWRMGVLGATVANYSGRVRKAVRPSEFMPSDRPRKRQLSEAELRARMQRMVDNANG